MRLIEEPWCSDRRLRLLRNDAGVAFAVGTHTLADAHPPIRFLDELPVYHLDLLLTDRARREAKVARYDSELFGLLTPEGEPFNQAFYLPEVSGGGHATAPLPPDDAEHVACALDAPRDPSRKLDPSSVTLHDRTTVAWYAPRIALPEDAYRATIELARPLPPFTAQRTGHLVWVEVTNEGTARWPGGDRRDPQIRLGMSWRPTAGGLRHDVGRTMLPHALDPGQRALVPVSVCGPPQSGPVELVLDLVHENVRWFNLALTAEIEVGPSVDRRVAALTEHHGPLIPLKAAMQERRAVGVRDGLLRQDAPGAAPTDPEIAKLTASLPVGAWAIDAQSIDRLVELVRAERPSTIAEFGSGTSTVVLAYLLAERHQDGPRLVCFEQDPAGAEQTRAALAECGLDWMAAVIQLEVGEHPGSPPHYVMTTEATELLNRLAPRLILVNGPTLDSGASRLGTLDVVAPHLLHDATVLLNDALRDAELSISVAWARRDDVLIHGIRPTPKGLLEASLRAPRRRGRAAPHSPHRGAAALRRKTG